jgi:hypothetical protein
MSDPSSVYSNLANERNPGSNAQAIPGSDTSGSRAGRCNSETLVDPDLFLGGSTACLRSLRLWYIPFAGLSKLLLSATHLTNLHLSHSGPISPEATVSCISALTRLETLILDFGSFESEHRRPPPPTRTLLPSLTRLRFDGVSEYLEGLVVRIDTPLLDNLEIAFYESTHDTAQLAQFINRTPKLKAHNEAHVFVNRWGVRLMLRVFEKRPGISHEVVDWQVSSVARICTSSFSQALSFTVERLYICGNYVYDMQAKNNHWLELLRPFTSVKSLYLSRANVDCIAPALQVAGVLPALQILFLQDLNLLGRVQKAIGLFVSRRQLSGHPVAVSQWKYDYD